jgi:hypothetical protein
VLRENGASFSRPMFRDMNGQVVKPVERQTVFALLDKGRARPGTKGPIVSIHSSEKAAKRAADPSKHAIVELWDFRAWKAGDHPNPMSDCVMQKTAAPVRDKPTVQTFFR